MAAERPYKAFLSSTYRDLKNHRAHALKALRGAGFFVDPMEDWTAEEDEPKLFSQARVNGCDLCILLVAFRRGHVPHGESLSITQLEHEYARTYGIDILVYMLDEGAPWPRHFDEIPSDPGIKAWRAELREKHGVATFGLEPASLDLGPALARWLARRLRFSTLSGPELTRDAETVLARLKPLLSELLLPQTVLRRLYQQSAPPGWEPLPASANSALLLDHCLSSLAQAPRQGGTGAFPLLRFVYLLRDHLPGREAGLLEARLHEATDQLARDKVDARKMWQAIAAPLVEDETVALCHLLVQVEQGKCNPMHYAVKAWLLGTGTLMWPYTDVQETKREGLPGVLEALLDELDRPEFPPDKTWVEFLLPRELLSADVDQWKKKLDLMSSIQLCVEHQVIVRSLERARARKAWPALQARWQGLLRRAGAPCRVVDGLDDLVGDECAALWIEGEDCDGSALYTRLRDTPGIFGALLGHPPTPAPACQDRDVLTILLQAGIPVIVWARRCAADSPTAVRAELSRLFGDDPVLELPERIGQLPESVWRLRKDAVARGDKAHLGRHVSLLWDDPTRRSPDFEQKHQLRPPAKG
jgi:hypothetical protein